MIETPSLSLPLLQAAQSQKHVTVNEALVRLDGITQLVLKSATIAIPPGLAVEGDCYFVPSGATGAWSGQEGSIAVYSNNGWVFIFVKPGWRAWIVDVSADAIFDGTNWLLNPVALSPNGAATIYEVIEFDHEVTTGATSTVTGAISGGSIVIGVTGRVTQSLGGSLTGWQLGIAGSLNRYGSGLGTQIESWVRGLTATPVTYYTTEDLVLTSEGADFENGSVRLAVHAMRLKLPMS